MNGTPCQKSENLIDLPYEDSVKFAREEYSTDLVAQMIPLWQIHHKETTPYPEIPLEPDISIYENCALTGSLRIFTARQETRLVGYQVFFILKHPHSRNSLQANQDIVFLQKSLRRGLVGYKFLKFCSDALLAEGCDVVYQHISADADFGPVLRRMGYNLIDLVYGRRRTENGRTACQPPSR